MECVSEDTLASNLSKGRLFDCHESGCRCVGCMTKERMHTNAENNACFNCDQCRLAKNKCHNPECNETYAFNCSACSKAKYCSKEVSHGCLAYYHLYYSSCMHTMTISSIKNSIHPVPSQNVEVAQGRM